MEFPKNSESYSRSRDIQKKVEKTNFYKHPGDVCRLDAYLDASNSRIFSNAKGISPTIQGIIRVSATAKELFSLVGGNMFMKSFPEIVGTQKGGRYDASLAMEVFILRYLSYFKSYRISPCIQQYYTDFVCPRTSDKISSEVFGAYQAMRPGMMARNLIEFNDPSPNVRYVMTEFIPGQSVRSSIKSLTDKDVKQILFQVFYTCDQFSRAGVRHNDIHSENVFLKPITPTNMYFFTPQGIVLLEGCRYLVKVIDYDQSVFYDQEEWVLENKKYVQNQDRCSSHGGCSVGINPKKDQVLFLTFLIEDMKFSGGVSSFVRKFCEKVSSDPQRMLFDPVSIYKSGWTGHLCYNPRFIAGLPVGAPENRGKCTNWIPSDDLFKPFSYMVEKNLFELPTIPFTPENVNKIPMDNAWVSLALNDKAYQQLEALRKNIRKPLQPITVNLPKKSPSKPIPSRIVPGAKRDFFSPAPIRRKEIVIPPRAVNVPGGSNLRVAPKTSPKARASFKVTPDDDRMDIVVNTPDDDRMDIVVNTPSDRMQL